MRILEAKQLSKRFGGLLAVDRLDLHIDEGQILGLIGPNGAGKTTAFNCIAGVFQATSGEISFYGEKTDGQKPWDLCKKGLARTFQVVKPFATKSVLYNATVGAFARTGTRAKAEAKGLEVLEYLHLAKKKDAVAGNLTIAERKRLEIARALATEPKLLLLDEVMAGLRPTEVDEMVHIIKDLRNKGITIFLIEHIMRAVMTLSDRIIVIQYGKKIAEGTPKEIASDEKVIKAYLGEDYGAA
jgi:branched-chain amino acid transport system ATP-binding protein